MGMLVQTLERSGTRTEMLGGTLRESRMLTKTGMRTVLRFAKALNWGCGADCVTDAGERDELKRACRRCVRGRGLCAGVTGTRALAGTRGGVDVGRLVDANLGTRADWDAGTGGNAGLAVSRTPGSTRAEMGLSETRTGTTVSLVLKDSEARAERGCQVGNARWLRRTLGNARAGTDLLRTLAGTTEPVNARGRLHGCWTTWECGRTRRH